MFKSKVVGFLFFALLFILLDVYTWQGVRVLIKNSDNWVKKLVAIIYWGYSAALVVFMGLMRSSKLDLNPITLRFIAGFIFSIFIVKLLWVIFLLLDDGIRVVKWFWFDIRSNSNISGFESQANGGISRSKFITYLGLGFGALFFGSAVWGVFKGAHNYVIRKRKLKLRNLPKSFAGLKIVQISDIHSGSFWDRDAVIKGVELINKQNPDMVFFTGDLVNDTAKEAHPWIDVFKKIKAPLGVFSILGNHDYGDYVIWDNPKEKLKNMEMMYQNHKALGWNLLLDENRVIEKNGEKIAIIGVQNWSEKGRFPKYGDLNKAMEGLSQDISTKLLLSHDPSHWKAQVVGKTDIDVTFSGHTHGMQFGIDSKFYRWSPVKYLYKEWIDLYTENYQHLYVNRGFGYLGYPGRMGIYPEITVFTLA